MENFLHVGFLFYTWMLIDIACALLSTRKTFINNKRYLNRIFFNNLLTALRGSVGRTSFSCPDFTKSYLLFAKRNSREEVTYEYVRFDVNYFKCWRWQIQVEYKYSLIGAKFVEYFDELKIFTEMWVILSNAKVDKMLINDSTYVCVYFIRIFFCQKEQQSEITSLVMMY